MVWKTKELFCLLICIALQVNIAMSSPIAERSTGRARRPWRYRNHNYWLWNNYGDWANDEDVDSGGVAGEASTTPIVRIASETPFSSEVPITSEVPVAPEVPVSLEAPIASEVPAASDTPSAFEVPSSIVSVEALSTPIVDAPTPQQFFENQSSSSMLSSNAQTSSALLLPVNQRSPEISAPPVASPGATIPDSSSAQASSAAKSSVLASSQIPIQPSANTSPVSVPSVVPVRPATTGSNIFVAIDSGMPPAQITTKDNHPEQGVGLSEGHAKPVQTNKFYTNWLLGDQSQSVFAHPYSLQWVRGAAPTLSWGMAISHVDRSQTVFGPGNPASCEF